MACNKSLRAVWRRHSLTYVMTIAGAALCAAAFWITDDRWFDLCMGLGQGTLTAALVYWLSRILRETRKPED